MKQEIQLYVNGQRVELFEDESLQITSSIQDIKDISKIFTDYSQNFSVKATRNNNNIFKHYYNSYITNGYDARKKSDAIIEVNHQFFRKGKVQLNRVQMKNNRAYAYDLTFYGETVNLKDLLGDDLLSSMLYLNNYNFNLTSENIKDGLVGGLTLNGQANAIIYPLISPEYRFIFNSDGVASSLSKVRNIASPTLSSDGACVHSEDLKPAIRLVHIMEAIENKYGLTFSDDFLTDLDFTELYMWLHRQQGLNVLSSEVEFLLDTIVEEPTWLGVTFSSDRITIEGVQSGYCSPDFIATEINIFTTSSSATFDFRVTKDGVNFFESNDNTGDTSYLFELGGLTDGEYQIYLRTADTVSFSGSIDVAVLADGECINNSASNSATIGSKSSTTNVEINITDQIPEMKVIDFLTGIFKTFNLTSYVDRDGVIVVDTLDRFYEAGDTYDITEYVDMTSSKIERTPLFNEISFKFQEPKTFLAINFKNQNNEEFGSEYYRPMIQGESVTGNKYDITLPFEKVVYERINDDFDDSLSTVGYGYFVDGNQNTIVAAPLIFYRQSQGTETFYLRDLEDTTAQPITTYNRPSNGRTTVFVDPFTFVELYVPSSSINFDTEKDEYYTKFNNSTSLYQEYYNNYISSVYDFRSRILKIEAVLPLNILTKYKLNDRFIIGDTKYKINSITSNLLNNKSDLELIPDL